MAGTSGDGIDAAVIRVAGSGEQMQVRLVEHVHRSFPRKLRERLMAAMAPAVTSTEAIAILHADLGEAFGRVAREAIQGLSRRERPEVVGLAGQTICHLPGRAGRRTVTLQLGHAPTVAAMTGRPVVFDFRQSDVAAGGQGAPLVPWTDYVLFRDSRLSRAIQNIGGIGNVTWLPAGGQAEDVIAFDTGPGNMIIDGLASLASRGRLRMDRDGRLAAKGKVLESILTRWMSHPFLRQRPPRTTGRETFGMKFVEEELKAMRSVSNSPADWLATATAFTATTITLCYRRFLPGFLSPSDCAAGARHSRRPRTPPEIVLTGGGSRNRTLVGMLRAQMPEARIITIDELGMPAEAKEAVSFAMLALARLDGVASNLPAVTGARQGVSLGSVCGQALF
jgi:anhydro-N-acetylmuramic acid kinase